MHPLPFTMEFCGISGTMKLHGMEKNTMKTTDIMSEIPNEFIMGLGMTIWCKRLSKEILNFLFMITFITKLKTLNLKDHSNVNIGKVLKEAF